MIAVVAGWPVIYPQERPAKSDQNDQIAIRCKLFIAGEKVQRPRRGMDHLAGRQAPRHIRAPEISTNIGFGDADRKALYIAARTSIRVNTPGS